MKPTRLLAAAVALAAALPAAAEDAMAVLKKVEDRMYFPQDNGLKDLQAMMTIEQEGGPQMPGMGFKLAWKEPDQRVCRLQLPDELSNSPQGGMIAEMMEQQVGGQMNAMVAIIVPVRYAGRQDEYDFTAAPDGALTKITGTRKADAKASGSPEAMTLWIDAKYAPVKMASTAHGKESEMADLKYEEKGGKLVLKSAAMADKEGGPGMKLSFEYAQTGPVWLVSTVKMDSAQGVMTMKVGGAAVNKGVDDAVFAPPKKKAAPAGLDR